MHQVLCTMSNEGNDVRCNICGQGFLVYWSRFSRAEQDECRRVIQDHLRNHHAAALSDAGDRAIHPPTAFNVPEWTGLPHFSAAALLSNNQSIALDDVA